ncbi:NADH-quinone oxidoreductase subunit NuoE [Blastochloris viridis]|uniref:NADH-quinone oxidoreductase chain 2 n=1 Tax=Blastochloris viridis TaxID=1079 RepID=A0A0H5BFP6_BLAVI|nr:NADH-quinone oxidoreductase subunit NuoE [Blastochloris viridis]ALK09108.1 NADH-quinone oxidoreductase chain 2 [Blastochloris viridis]BAS01028.1 NADH-ubiquinone oxidoreductase chain E [Blastochloris viridis]CUU41771.1 NADH-quinone oxidoreductase chain 2 [Blastochloris viridis]
MTVRRLAPAEQQPATFAFTADNLAWANSQIAKYPAGRQASAVIALLWRAQEQSGGWLSQKAIECVAALLDMPNIRVLEVATFYTMFNLEPVGEHFIQVCGTTPCQLRGADELKKVCERKIGHERHVSADGKFSWAEVECLGACVNAPMVQIGADYFEDLTTASLETLIDDLAAGRPVAPGPQVERQFSAPIGGPTTLTGWAADAKPAAAKQPVLADAEAKRPGEAASVRESPAPKKPLSDAAMAGGADNKPAGAGSEG